MEYPATGVKLAREAGSPGPDSGLSLRYQLSERINDAGEVAKEHSCPLLYVGEDFAKPIWKVPFDGLPPLLFTHCQCLPAPMMGAGLGGVT